MLTQLEVLAGLAAALALAIVAGKVLARHRLHRLGSLPGTALLAALEMAPDGRSTVVAFSTRACAACHSAQRPALRALEALGQGRVQVVEVDAGERPDLARSFGVLTVPCTVVLGPDGRVLAANQGFAPAERLARQAGLVCARAGTAPD